MGFDSPRIDYTDRTSVDQGLAQVLAATGGRLDALFNNGAHGLPGAVEDLPREGLEAIFAANFFGWHQLTRAVIPVMRGQGGGRIIHCSSVLGFVGYRWRGAYGATKFALEGLTDTLRIEMRGTGVHLVLIEPGPITSDIRANSIPHFERWIDWQASARAEEYRSLLDRLYKAGPKDRFELPASAVTQVLVRALEARHPRARYRVTTPTHVAALLKRILPTWAVDRILGGR
jgi:NAD(P)-dependent dehydrogenase (short-subunit alcohol dehydrogenase family)